MTPQMQSPQPEFLFLSSSSHNHSAIDLMIRISHRRLGKQQFSHCQPLYVFWRADMHAELYYQRGHTYPEFMKDELAPTTKTNFDFSETRSVSLACAYRIDRGHRSAPTIQAKFSGVFLVDHCREHSSPAEAPNWLFSALSQPNLSRNLRLNQNRIKRIRRKRPECNVGNPMTTQILTKFTMCRPIDVSLQA
ncbi:hypothetical protein TWF694_006837 [Orbilia ellipsospora]|uniref:Uncharacterized protein n=1 Tax=Orbilia ellipsospora TaxID=2528407 RepID=A0AAV9XT36_9PEZI